MFRRFLSIFIARNKEYYRDRAAFGWNFAFPFLIILGFAAIFQNGGQPDFKFGVISPPAAPPLQLLDGQRLISPVPFVTREEGLQKLAHHKIDILIEAPPVAGETPQRYWVSDTSPGGIIAESLFLRLLSRRHPAPGTPDRATVAAVEVAYIDWMFPGIIAMSMMFSALYGVGYTIVRYRENGVLKRLKATPLTAFEYLSAQIVSRLFLILASCAIVYCGCALIFGFQCQGSYFDLILLFSLGTTSIISLSLIVAARTASEEFANGVLNLISWPMMFLSEVWFSLEGAPDWLKGVARLFPLSHVTEGMRMIMNDGAGLADIRGKLLLLAAMTIFFTATGSFFFKWVRG